MGNSFETPESNVMVAALNLLRHKMLVQLADDAKYASVKMEDVIGSTIRLRFALNDKGKRIYK